MNKKILASAVSLLLSLGSAKAEDWVATDWLRNIPDNVYVANLSIPGTHDTATSQLTNWKDQSQTQDKSLDEQLNIGIRAFDFRPRVKSNSYLNCEHGFATTSLRFDDALKKIKDFINIHPSEFAICHILYSTSYDSEKDNYYRLLNELINGEELKDYIIDYRRDLTLGEMRGKILLMYRDDYSSFESAPKGGCMKDWCGSIDWYWQTNGSVVAQNKVNEYSEGSLYMQDQAETHNDGDDHQMSKKLEGLNKLLNYGATHYTEDPHQLVWKYNFASAYSKRINYLVTKVSSSDGYRDNASYTNKAIIDFLDATTTPGPTGIILMDYVGVESSNGYTTYGIEVVDKIIENNFRYIRTRDAYRNGVPVVFERDTYREIFNKMNAGAKNAVPFMADFDNNGVMDILFSGEGYLHDDEKDEWYWGDPSYVSFNNGAGAPEQWNTIWSSQGASLPVYYGGLGSRFFDFNQDGTVDMLLLDCLASGWRQHPNEGNKTRVRLAKNKGDKSFEEITSACDWSTYQEFNNSDGRTNKGCAQNCIAIADVNMDGYPDILLQNENGDPWERVTKLYINQQGNGYKEAEVNYFIPANNGSVLLGDLNGDGYPDAVVSGWGNEVQAYGTTGGPRLDFYKNDGKGNFTLANNDINTDVNYTSNKWGHYGTDCAMYMIDYDQDGKLDILLMGDVNNAGTNAAANGKRTVLLRNISENGNLAFEEQSVDIWPTTGNMSRLAALADFNGNGFVDFIGYGWGGDNGNGGYDWGPNICAYASYSTGKDSHETIYNVFSVYGEEGYFSFGDLDGDGLLDFMSPANGDNGNPYFYRNRSLAGKNVEVQVPGAPTNLQATYDAENRRLTLTWDKMMTESGSKAIYNAFIVKNGQTFMTCPADKATGKQLSYLPFNNYMPSETCFFENVEPGVYQIGVQSVAYSYNASGFTTQTVIAKDKDEAFERDDNFTAALNMGAKQGVPFMADFSGNGKMDILFSGESFFGGWGDDAFVAFNNDGAWNTLSTQNGADLPVYYGGLGSRMFDFNQDGTVDMLLLDFLGAGWSSKHPNEGAKTGVRMVKNNGNQTFEEITSACGWSELTELNSSNGRANGECALNSVAVADVNMDGYPDVLLQNENANPWERVTKLYINKEGNGYEEAEGSHFIPTNGGSVFLGDLNGDGYPDAVVSGWANENSTYGTAGGPRLDFYKNDGKGNFTLANTDINPDVNYTSGKWGHSGTECAMYMFDYDQDGKLDIYIMGGLDNAGVDSKPNGKKSVLLRNVSENGTLAFEEMSIDIWPASATLSNLSALADFNGDGFVDFIGFGWGGENGEGGYNWMPNWQTYGSFSTGKGSFTTEYGLFPCSDGGYYSFGDADGDGMLDFMSPNNSNNGSPYLYRNKMLAEGGQIQVPGVPTHVEASYDAATRRLTLTWDKMMTESGSKAIYNVYIVKDGKTFMRCPALKENGKLMSYQPLNSYLPSETCFFENIEPGVYEIGVQSVAYSYNASEFNTQTIVVLDESKAAGIEADTQAEIVILKRGMKSGIWNSFCIPFDMEIPEGWEVKALSDASGIHSDYIALHFSDAESIEAGKPYMVRTAEAVSEITATDKTVVNAPVEDSKNGVTFTGTFVSGTAPVGSYFISGNQFWQAEDDTNTFKGYRGYITADDAAGVNTLRFFIDGDLVTGIGAAENDGKAEIESIHDLNGVRLPKLQKGINLVKMTDGSIKKIIIK